MAEANNRARLGKPQMFLCGGARDAARSDRPIPTGPLLAPQRLRSGAAELRMHAAAQGWGPVRGR